MTRASVPRSAGDAGLTAEDAQARAERWQIENRAAIDEWNAYVEEHGIPLAEYRQFGHRHPPIHSEP